MPAPVEVPPVTIAVEAPERPAAGAPFFAAVVLGVPDGWHIYWENPGQSGLATDVRLQAGGVPTEGPAWPAPTRFTTDGLTSYGYAGPTGFVFTLPAQKAGAVELVAEGTWLLCKDICVRGEGMVRTTMPVGRPARAAEPNVDPLASHVARLPVPFAESGGIATVGEALTLRLPGPGPFEVYPSVALEAAWTPSLREEDGALVLEAPLRAPVAPGAYLVVTRGEGPDRRAYTLPVTPPEAPR